MEQHCYVVSMARCPYCMSPVSKFDEICRTCGRIITGSAGSSQRATGQFNTGAHSGGATSGAAPQMMNAPRRMQSRRRKKGKLGKLVIVSIIACVFVFTPANELAMSQWANVSSQLQILTAPVYPMEATYTVDRTLTMSNKIHILFMSATSNKQIMNTLESMTVVTFFPHTIFFPPVPSNKVLHVQRIRLLITNQSNQHIHTLLICFHIVSPGRKRVVLGNSRK